MADGAVFTQTGARITYTNASTAIAATDVVPIASGTSGICGVAVTDIAATTGTGEVDIAGIFTLPKTAGEAFTQGQVVYWDDTAGSVTGVSTTTVTRIGRAVAAAASAATSCTVNLNVA